MQTNLFQIFQASHLFTHSFSLNVSKESEGGKSQLFFHLHILIFCSFQAIYEDSLFSSIRQKKEKQSSLIQFPKIFQTQKFKNAIYIYYKSQMQSPSSELEPKDPIPHHTYIKLQLPSVFSIRDEAELSVEGFRFDPNLRLASTKEVQTIRKENIGSLLPKIKEEIKASFSTYEEKNWKNIQRELSAFAFELQIAVRVNKINKPSIEVRPLVGCSQELFQLIEIDLNADTDATLKDSITKTAESVLQSFKNHKFQAPKWSISFAPQKLFNPHVFIKTQAKDKYIEYYTKGVYEYYHYGDQSFNDHGWGCAYRSLQSLLSWLTLQNHLKLSKMLTISQIQELIDRINLSSREKLRGTKEWIGATEVSWVVKQLTGLDCRIVHISDGKKIIEECEMFREHFERVGSPIMYGGGEYAYSIVGLNYSWKLGECEFLILDPHFTGPDSLEKVVEKKGLSWRKPEEMFKKGIFYNFCLPMLP